MLASLRPIQDQVLRLLRKLLKWLGKIKSMRSGCKLKSVDQVLRGRARSETSLEQRLRPIGDDLCRIEVVLAAQAIALRARPINAVKGERTRLQDRNVDAAFRTGQLRRVQPLLAFDDGDQHQAVGQLHGQLDRLHQPALDARLHQQPIDDQLDGMVLALVELDFFVRNIAQLAVDARAGKSLLYKLIQLFLELSLSPAHDGRHDHHALFRPQLHHPLHDLVCRLTRNFPSALRDNEESRPRSTAAEGNRRFQ